MCFSNCPYENRTGNCGLSLRNYPADAHCADVDDGLDVPPKDTDNPHVEEQIKEL